MSSLSEVVHKRKLLALMGDVYKELYELSKDFPQAVYNAINIPHLSALYKSAKPETITMTLLQQARIYYKDAMELHHQTEPHTVHQSSFCAYAMYALTTPCHDIAAFSRKDHTQICTVFRQCIETCRRSTSISTAFRFSFSSNGDYYSPCFAIYAVGLTTS